ncbi:UNVERIFIED_CONTAM: Dirigent protein 4 [Sesamum latifolium]|uniref:Dirigent protein n=1 Tax=Sesamum latifolium TaxID=2727402 RepID=A0AAW2YFH1_9LAMI
MIIIAITTCDCAIDQSPKAVRKWAKTLNPANHQKLTKLHFFCHHLHNATATTIAKATTTDASPTFFGLLDTRDDPLTLGPEESSERLGYAQGISAAASLEEISSFDPFTFVFTSKEHNGSTLAVLGSCPISRPSCEAAVVGGSGGFRLARGLVTSKSYYMNFTSGKAILEISVVALHY